MQWTKEDIQRCVALAKEVAKALTELAKPVVTLVQQIWAAVKSLQDAVSMAFTEQVWENEGGYWYHDYA